MTDRFCRLNGGKWVAAAFLAATLTACGGGGGGGGGNPPPSGGGGTNPPPTTNPPGGTGGTNNTPLPAQITYTGVTTQAKLGARSSPVIAGALLYELGLGYADRPLPTSQAPMPRPAAKLSSTAATASKARRLRMQDVTIEQCAGGGTVHIDDQTNEIAVGTIRLTYTTCVEDGFTTEGAVVLNIAAYDLVQDVPTDFTATFYGYTESVAGNSIDIGGSIRTVRASQTASSTTYDTVTRYRPENVEYRLENVIVSQSLLPQVGSAALYVQGRIYHSTYGYIDITTRTALGYNTYAHTASAGTLRLQGSESSWADVTFMPSNTLRLALDENGDGVAERSMLATGLGQLTLANHRPSANAGPDLTLIEGQTVTLNGSGNDWEGDPLTYRWTVVGGPVSAGSTIGNTAQASFTPTRAGVYVIQLSVSDLPPYTSVDVMTLSVTPNADPVARAGADVTTSEGATVVLDGGASTDAENDPITFSWSLVTAPAGSTAPATVTGQSWNFVPDRPGTYEYRLNAADNFGATFDNVRVTAGYLLSFGLSSDMTVDASTTQATAQRSGTVTVSNYYSGAPIGLSVSTNVAWLNVVSSPANTGSSDSVIVGIVPAQIALLANGTHTAQVTVTPAGFSPRTATIALNLQLPEVQHVTPYVAYQGAEAPVTLYGSALQHTVGGTLLVDGAEVQGFSDSIENRARITLPALTVGEHELRVRNNLGIERSSARFVVRPAPTYPDGEVDILGRIESLEYDAERDAFYVVSWNLNYSQDFDAYRLRYDGTQWQRDAIPVTDPMAVSLNVDGTRLYVTKADCGVVELDPATFAVLQTRTAPYCSYEFYGMVHGLADGRIFVGDTNQWPTVYNYPAFTVASYQFGDLYSPIDLLNGTRERLLWAESPSISGPHELYIYDVATSSFQEVAIHDPETYFLSWYLGISGNGQRVMHGADVYDGGQYIGTLQDMLPLRPNPALTWDGSRAVVFNTNTNTLSVFDLTSGPNFPLVTNVMTPPDTIGTANVLRLLPNDSVAFLFSIRYVSQDNYVFKAYVRNLP
jgi:hypothetical protein